jgi:hypothetical protein
MAGGFPVLAIPARRVTGHDLAAGSLPHQVLEHHLVEGGVVAVSH